LVSYLEESKVQVLGPPALFIRLKVNHPVVKKVVRETLGRLLGAIVLDRRDSNKDIVKSAIFRTMHRGQNWAYINFPGAPKSEPIHGALVLADSNNLEEAVKLSINMTSKEDPNKNKRENDDTSLAEVHAKLSMNLDTVANEEQNKNKRKNEDVTSLAEMPAKRSKLEVNDGKAENIDESEDSDEDEDYSSPPHTSIYTVDDPIQQDPDFPTILELLDIDNSVIKELLVSRCQINTSLVVPQFERFLNYKSVLSKGKGWLCLGRDMDGRIASVNPDSFKNDSDSAMIGFIENLCCIGEPAEVGFWGGPDLRNKWPEFTDHLAKIDQVLGVSSNEKSQAPTLNLKVSAVKPSSSDCSKATSSSSDIMALLAARGISVSRK